MPIKEKTECECGKSWVEIEHDPPNGFDAYKSTTKNMELREGSAYLSFHCKDCGEMVDKMDKYMHSFNQEL